MSLFFAGDQRVKLKAAENMERVEYMSVEERPSEGKIVTELFDNTDLVREKK